MLITGRGGCRVPEGAGRGQTCTCVLGQAAQKQTLGGEFMCKRFIKEEGGETGEREEEEERRNRSQTEK